MQQDALSNRAQVADIFVEVPNLSVVHPAIDRRQREMDENNQRRFEERKGSPREEGKEQLINF